MVEAQRFLRFVIPGLILVIEVSLYLFLSSYQDFIKLIKYFGKNISVPISVFLASGGIGFLLGVFYYTLIWRKWISLIGVDHRSALKDAERRGWLQFQRRADGVEIDTSKYQISQRGGWRIVNAYWYSRAESSQRIKGASPRSVSLADVTHGLGTTFVGSLIAIPLWLLLHLKLTGQFPALNYYYLIPPIVSFIHFLNFKGTAKDLQSVVDSVLINELRSEFEQKKEAIVWNLAPIDLEKRKPLSRNAQKTDVV